MGDSVPGPIKSSMFMPIKKPVAAKERIRIIGCGKNDQQKNLLREILTLCQYVLRNGWRKMFSETSIKIFFRIKRISANNKRTVNLNFDDMDRVYLFANMLNHLKYYDQKMEVLRSLRRLREGTKITQEEALRYKIALRLIEKDRRLSYDFKKSLLVINRAEKIYLELKEKNEDIYSYYPDLERPVDNKRLALIE